MALGTDHVILSEVANFVPQLWSDEVVASYKSNLVFAPLVRRLNHRGKKGSSIKIPTPTRGEAEAEGGRGYHFRWRRQKGAANCEGVGA